MSEYNGPVELRLCLAASNSLYGATLVHLVCCEGLSRMLSEIINDDSSLCSLH
jgi:hypothetical protein